jgi:hypothetical protein
MDLSYYIQDLTAVGLPKSYFSIFSNLFTDRHVQKYNPQRYHFYVQLMQALMNPQSKDMAKLVLELQAANKMKREDTRERLQRITNALSFLYASAEKSSNPDEERRKMLKKLAARLSANPLTSNIKLTVPNPQVSTPVTPATPAPQAGGATIDFKELISGLVNKHLDKLIGITGISKDNSTKLKVIVNKLRTLDLNSVPEILLTHTTELTHIASLIKGLDSTSTTPEGLVKLADQIIPLLDKILKDVNSSSSSSPSSSGPSNVRAVDPNKSIFTILNEDLKKADTEEKQKNVMTRYLNDPVASPDNMKITSTDRIVFVAGTFILRSIALFIVQWGINTYLIRDFKNAFMLYVTSYLCIFMLWVILANSKRDIKFFKLLFFYISYTPHGYGRIIIHTAIQLLLLPVPFLIRDPTSTTNNDMQATPLTIEQRQDIMRTIGTFTFIMWILTSFIAFSY